ncbi:MAG: SDR family NAD(P)-dependent oxidoreductase [Deltaproteobacteria bacterium]
MPTNINISGKNIFMTGATAGLGKVAALYLADQGANLIVLSRDKVKTEKLLTEFKQKYPSSKGNIDIVEGNLNSFSSIITACNTVKRKINQPDVIIHNAGIMNFNPVITENGIEETLQVNLLSPILINHILLPEIDSNRECRVIFTASGLHQGDINFENIEFKGNFSGFRVYRQSKLGVILLVRLLSEKLSKYNINFYCQHPGLVRTELGRNAGWLAKTIFNIMGKSPEKGAQTLIYLAETNKDELIRGEYYAYKKVKKITQQSYDLNTAEKLLKIIQDYLRRYLNHPSLIFPAGEKNI